MKKKSRNTQQKNSKLKPRETLANVLTFTLFGALFLLCGIAIYFDEKRKLEKTDEYLNSLPSLEDSINHENICMDDDLYSLNVRTPVLIMNKKYYGCNQKAIEYLTSNESLRFAIDPVNKDTIDKATAIISLHPDRNGKVIYFGSEQTYNTYLMALKRTKRKEVEFNNE